MKKAKPRNLRVEMVETLSLSELTVFCDANTDLVITLVDHGVVTPVAQSAPEWEFTPPHIARARKAARLMRDLGLNVAGVALVLDLIEERDALARKLALMGA
ncbi:chaperone modulatory protein CbpM [Yoonia maricola]|uniref:Chaperone modulatory protein CbpM n=1 Tax=Yoonia maricola TaxID=420999 RepID=A0A2M8W062_9RHOB|nr:chaperone modulator CbpM [Yoonia maricola]PJI84308.1 chaperone modulatory protein CbpM [Yoonia maricola]